MSGASDIAKLFEVAGGSPAQYQEVERTEQIEGARGRWSTHADAQPDLAAQGDADLDASQPLIVWSIAAVATEPPPVLPVAQEPPAIGADVQASLEAPVEAPVETGMQAEAPAPAAAQPRVEPVIQDVAVARTEPEPAIPPTPQPAAAPQSAALSSVFARLMERNEPRGDVAPRGKS
jgi:hypothetical protein